MLQLTIYNILGCEERTILHVFYVHSFVHSNSFTKIFTCPKIRRIYSLVTSHYLLNYSAIAFCLQHRPCIWSLLFPPIFYFLIHWFPSFNCSACSTILVFYCPCSFYLVLQIFWKISKSVIIKVNIPFASINCFNAHYNF